MIPEIVIFRKPPLVSYSSGHPTAAQETIGLLLHSPHSNHTNRRLQRSCRGFIEIRDAEDLPSAGVTLLYLTVKQYPDRSQRFKDRLDKADKRSLRDSALALMAMSLRLLKVYQHSNRSLGWEDVWVIEEGIDDRIKSFFTAMSSAERSTATSQTAYVEELFQVLSFFEPDWIALYYKSLLSFDSSLSSFHSSSLGPDVDLSQRNMVLRSTFNTRS